MAQLVSATCPNCRRRLRLDPQLDVASCGFCHKSSFVQTRERRVPAEALRGASVIDLTRRSRMPVAVWALGSAGLVAIGAVFWLQARPSSPGSSVVTAGHETTSVVKALEAPAAEPPLEAAPEPLSEAAAVPPSPAPSSTLSPSDPAEPLPSKAPGKTNGPAGKPVHSIVRGGAVSVSGRSSPALIQKVVRQSYARFRLCHEQGLSRNAALQGRVSIRFVIGRDGRVSNVSLGDSTLADAEVTRCMAAAFSGLEFPPPESGIATVVYPLLLSVET